MSKRHDIRLALLALAILAGLGLQKVESRDLADCDPCDRGIETS